MRLPREQQDTLDAIYDEAILTAGKDHLAAANKVIGELKALEAGGHKWAGVILEAAMLDGINKRVKSRARRSVVSVPSKTGKRATMPTTYSRKNADGTHQLEMWADLPLDALRDLIESLSKQASTIGQRATRMQRGYDLAVEHNVPTARAGFKAAGIELDAEQVAS